MPSPKKQDWHLYSKIASGPEYRVALGHCTEQHALSVADALMHDPWAPHDLFLVPVKSVHDPEPIGDEIECIPPERRVDG